MSFSINTNISSLQAQNYLQQSSNFQAQTINEVTSGLRIVNSGDDAAGLAIANGYEADEAVLTQGIQNANDGLSTLQTIDGGMDNINTLLDRASTLATESASGTFTGDRSTLNAEFQSVIGEINRQAQSIGMNTGGQFAKDLSVFIGGGQGATSAAATANGSIDLNLSNSTVDAQSLGLQGVQATGNTSTDIGTGSANTSVQSILANTANTASEKTSGYTTFNFSGPGFGGSSGISVAVNLAGVTDADTLATAINTAIQNAGNGSTQAATAFKNANISASVVTNSSGQQQLAFSSSNAAFQVQAGDQTANALLGNFAQNAALTGSDKNASLSTNGLGFTSLQVNGNSVSLSAATVAALAGGSVATSGSVSGAASVSDSAIGALNTNTGTGADSLVLNVNGTNQTVSIASGTTSLASIANQITAAGVGVTASISGSGTTQKLTLTSNATGSSSNVSVVSSGTTSELLNANITGFTGNTAGTAGTSGSVATATSGSVTGTSAASNSAIATALGSGGTLELNVNGVQQSLTLASTDTTLAAVVSDINTNDTSSGVTASDANGYLTLTSNDTGSNSNVTVLGAATQTQTAGLAAALGFSNTANVAGTAGQNATAPLTKGQVVNILNSDANFSSVATASLNGNQVVIQSNANTSTSSVQATGSLATALGFSTTAATAGSASTGASLNTTVQSAGAMGNINQAVISTLKGTATTGAAIVANGANSNLTLSVGGGTAVTLALGALASGSTTAAAAADINTAIAGSSLAGQVQAVVNNAGALTLTATQPGQTVTVGTSSSHDAATNLGFTDGQTSGTNSDALATSSDNIQVQFTGAGMSSPVTLSLSTTAGVTKMSDLLTSLTSQVTNNSALAAAGISLTTGSSGNNLVFTDNKGQQFQVAVTGDSTNALGFGSFASDSNGDFSYSTISGTSAVPTSPKTNTAASGSLNISLNGGATSAINVNLKSTSGTISGSAVTDAGVAADGLSGKTMVLDVDGTSKTVTFVAGDTTLAAVAATINGTSGIGATADIVGTGANQTLRLTSNSSGTASSVTVTGGGTATAAELAGIGLTAGQSGSGLANSAAVQADAVNQINAAIANNSALSAAGLQASVNSSGDLVLSSTNGTNFRVSGSGAANLGFGTTGGAYTGTTTSAAPTVGRVDSAGAYTTGAMNFSAIANGGDSQTISITATDANGGNHSTSVTLQNNATSQSGSNIDAAINAINTQLQQSNDSTLQSIYAVKEDNPNGTESINFMSTTQNFKVAASSLADGSGVAAPTGGVATATQNGAGANVSIDTISGAEAAVNALSTAVQSLGTAQAAVGKGENLLNYATSLAQSQVTNEAASESDIRDANLAQEAANLTKAQILMQAGTAALSQANSAPQQLLSLLQGH